MTTLTYRVMRRLLGREVRAGEIVTLEVATVMAHDGSGPVIARSLARHGIDTLAAADRAVLVFDHFYPPTSVTEAGLHTEARGFAARHGIPVYEGRGIAHQLLPELGLVQPGTVLVGADSHTCTGGAFGALAIGLGATDVAAVLATGRLWLEVPRVLRVRLTGTLTPPATGQDLVLQLLGMVGTSGALGMALEFTGPGVCGLRMSDRMKLANHAVEMGAVCGLLPVDQRTRRWLADRGADLRYAAHVADESATGDVDGADVDEMSIDLSRVRPMVALPSRPDRVRPLRADGSGEGGGSSGDREPGGVLGEAVQQVFIGSCAGGRLEDLREAAEVLRGQRVAPGVRLLVGPPSEAVLREAIADGTLTTLMAAGATVLPPGCGACLGRLGTLGDDEVCVSTQNRNFAGRSGSASARIYLASPTTAAHTAITGYLPGE
jgi:3-isopropylmalate/(R)-2-methylmalate dehydratase large subunit